MEGAALSKFDESTLLHGIETLIHYEEVMRDITQHVFLQELYRFRRDICVVI
jgi:hypothetical protein